MAYKRAEQIESGLRWCCLILLLFEALCALYVEYVINWAGEATITYGFNDPLEYLSKE